ncbi:FecR family protein [Membranihabitans maritimus]|uniref:FecR family protein n=1 Tax=Membranihabitans maritimus TaxID=2904244 RepID=UPI001F1E31D1|nr:FecR family protein [Membranihabitans maritimus]
MSDKQHIEFLFAKFKENSLSEEEFKILLDYFDRSESESKIKSLMDKQWRYIKKIPSNGPDIEATARYKKILYAIEENQLDWSKRNRKIARRSSSVSLKIIGIAATFLLITSSLILWKINQNPNVNSTVQTEQQVIQKYSGKQFVRLPDGSSVILNEGSELEFDGSFGKESRKVVFKGEGFFDISHNEGKPFIVRTGDVSTTVLGTAFNVSAYKNSDVVVTVERGKVAVGDNDNEYDKITPNQQLIVDTRTKKYRKEEVNLERELAWKNDFLILDGMTIEEAVTVIGQRYGVNVTVMNEHIKNCEINAAFMKGESLKQVLSVISGVLQAEYEIKDNSAVIKGGRSCE